MRNAQALPRYLSPALATSLFSGGWPADPSFYHPSTPSPFAICSMHTRTNTRINANTHTRARADTPTQIHTNTHTGSNTHKDTQRHAAKVASHTHLRPAPVRYFCPFLIMPPMPQTPMPVWVVRALFQCRSWPCSQVFQCIHVLRYFSVQPRVLRHTRIVYRVCDFCEQARVPIQHVARWW